MPFLNNVILMIFRTCSQHEYATHKYLPANPSTIAHVEMRYLPNTRFNECWQTPVLVAQCRDYKLYPSYTRGLKFSIIKFSTTPTIEPRTCWNRHRHPTIWDSTAHIDIDEHSEWYLAVNFTGLVMTNIALY